MINTYKLVVLTDMSVTTILALLGLCISSWALYKSHQANRIAVESNVIAKEANKYSEIQTKIAKAHLEKDLKVALRINWDSFHGYEVETRYCVEASFEINNVGCSLRIDKVTLYLLQTEAQREIFSQVLAENAEIPTADKLILPLNKTLPINYNERDQYSLRILVAYLDPISKNIERRVETFNL